MDGFVSSGQKRNYENFTKNISPLVRPLFDEIRDYCFSLGSNVIEDVRMHRIVFCKSFSFRFFADIEPNNDSITIKIQKGRKIPQMVIKIKPNQNLNETKNLLSEAYKAIR